MNSQQRFLKLLDVDLPLIQAPMAGVSTPAMAAAACNAGALGSIGVGASSAADAQKMIAAVEALSTRSLNVNVFCHRPARKNSAREALWLRRLSSEFGRFEAAPPTALNEIYRSFVEDDAMLAMLLQQKPKAVSLHFGMPDRERLAALKQAGIALLGSATSLDEATRLVEAGVDIIVAQGYEAGGHRGIWDPAGHDDRLGTLALTRILVQRLNVPVVAAGGIMDGAGISAALKLGACAAQLGTAFVGCSESAADQGYRAALAGAPAYHTIMTRAISGRPARCLSNRFTALGATVSNHDVPDYPIAYDAGKALHAAAKSAGEFGYGAQWAGQGAPLARSMTTTDLIALLVKELAQSH